MKLAWMTDLHLDLVEEAVRQKFFESVRNTKYDAAVVTGDISSPARLGRDLLDLGRACGPRRIFFVLGNHDIGPQGPAVEETVRIMCRLQRNLRPVWRQEVIPLTAHACVIGCHGGTCSDKHCFQAAAHFRKVLPRALSRFGHAWLLTHVPPFEQGVRFSGRPVQGAKREAFVNRPAGRVIAGIARRFEGRRVSVLAGHTHCRARLKISPTVDISVGGARRGFPEIQEIIDIP